MGRPTEAASPERAQQRPATGTPASHGGGGPKRGTTGPRQRNDSVSVTIRQRIADPQRASRIGLSGEVYAIPNDAQMPANYGHGHPGTQERAESKTGKLVLCRRYIEASYCIRTCREWLGAPIENLGQRKARAWTVHDKLHALQDKKQANCVRAVLLAENLPN